MKKKTVAENKIQLHFKKNPIQWFKDHFMTPGTVSSVADGIIVIEGELERAYVGEVVSFGHYESDVIGLVMNIERTIIKVALLTGGSQAVRAKDKVFLTRKGVKTKVGLGTIGRISTPLGVCLNQEDFNFNEFAFQEAWNLRLKDVESSVPSIIEREPVRTPVHTGINA